MPSKQDETAQLVYLKWDEKFDRIHGSEKPYEMRLKSPPANIPETNMESTLGPEEIMHNMREHDLKNFSLDDHGFAHRDYPLNIPNWNKYSIEGVYLPAICDLLRQEFGGDAEIKVFDWRLRTADESKAFVGKIVNLKDFTTLLQPISVVHVDESPNGARSRFQEFMKGTLEKYPEGRYRVVNVWRPLENPVEDSPLAVCDGSTVDDSILVAVDHVRRDYVGEYFRLIPSAKLKWYYLSKQTKDEVLLLKMYDSSPSVKAKCCPHASFQSKMVQPGTKPRESIEVRVLIFSPTGNINAAGI
ncbi:hypothetical protein B0O99DRAFT_718249 [Bisporella sp. PMI_857]|nr:hypothetical protein B0O99DRAFT_718249 [Bisporella sp. PMI_857]